ncbi:MAG: hypothetical protein UU73_C0002G0164 [Candidatus Daviesbacteria bacterium GW2011_GWA1_41_61]|uniref:Uncharacterized protein n=1 Tax=Candidatus Daviesbacteria bacterium GW2011_GWA2_40_9 TaxID=1618424 RepID=A0A0G0X726_9BACT|nr:MAG: hypothetical protein UU26_C0009G0037 [Candidatus Daviesbacteria bacterium GW2011_GWC1_40_9]KKR83442.1 MAG: hypothetical protein UU29_C0005G0023 [Candidatus Daviesbacteria bacterium GW2011_GWA2_40_9]KKR93824.1 MAG: hypothetical protein UU44_C0001G0164 [Candidatus Daviesbacteria bacterium GW2011_GWB1_41_15]KKS15290.1 MAG: hypothetical protein UU73_C0002G0164 [Candidatus Daviesbacteria bacterium GW2011_GWA1_41_61]
MQKGFAPILGILVILVAVSIGYVILIGFPENKKCGQVFACHGIPLNNQCIGYNSTFAYVDCAKTSLTDETVDTEGTRSANWKTYTNSKYGFSLKYPTSWTLTEFTNIESGSIYRVFDLKPQNEEDKRSHNTINFRYFNNLKKLSLEDFEREQGPNSEGAGNCGIYLPDDVLVKNNSGVDGYYRKKGICEPLDAKFYTWAKGDKIFQLIDFRWFNASEDKLLNEIFESVKFLE